MGQRRDICDRRRTYDELAATGRILGAGLKYKILRQRIPPREILLVEFAAANFAMKNLTG